MSFFSAVRAFTLAVLCLTGCGTAVAPSGAAPTARDPHHPTALPQPTLPSSPPTPSCSGEETILTAEPVNAAMGLRVQSMTLTNCGGQALHLNGYPGVRLLDETGDPLDVRIDEGAQQVTTAVRDPGPHPVTLRPGEDAHFALVWRNTYTDTT
ncbi:DUF4232 domain-containing protein, partial [Nonomuraea aridisoli]|uniref:DUF4232 domain-containing protein n=1 Tax=Nonomuraea aridisoli TaxID=2070368 RepID=UPI0015E8BBB5